MLYKPGNPIIMIPLSEHVSCFMPGPIIVSQKNMETIASLDYILTIWRDMKIISMVALTMHIQAQRQRISILTSMWTILKKL